MKEEESLGKGTFQFGRLNSQSVVAHCVLFSFARLSFNMNIKGLLSYNNSSNQTKRLQFNLPLTITDLLRYDEVLKQLSLTHHHTHLSHTHTHTHYLLHIYVIQAGANQYSRIWQKMGLLHTGAKDKKDMSWRSEHQPACPIHEGPTQHLSHTDHTYVFFPLSERWKQFT